MWSTASRYVRARQANAHVMRRVQWQRLAGVATGYTHHIPLYKLPMSACSSRKQTTANWRPALIFNNTWSCYKAKVVIWIKSWDHKATDKLSTESFPEIKDAWLGLTSLNKQLETVQTLRHGMQCLLLRPCPWAHQQDTHGWVWGEEWHAMPCTIWGQSSFHDSAQNHKEW